MLMIIVILVVLGLVFGSFINALVWRLHERAHRTSKKARANVSILKGRSMCPNCRHALGAKDLVPVISWLALKGKCRYCSKPISIQYPLVELVTSALFAASYIWWPTGVHGIQITLLAIWLALLVGLIALAVYDLKWYLLPNRLIYPSAGFAGAFALVSILAASKPPIALVNAILAVAVGGGIFYVLFQVSKGKWIGGGDVKLGWLLGLVVGTPARSLLFIFVASVAGTLASLPLLASHRLKRNSVIPFGPWLIFGAIITVLFGASIIHWYKHLVGIS